MMTPSARKLHGRYKAVIRHLDQKRGRERTETLGTRWWYNPYDGQCYIAKGAPLYDTREEAMEIARRVIEARMDHIRTELQQALASGRSEKAEWFKGMLERQEEQS